MWSPHPLSHCMEDISSRAQCPLLGCMSQCKIAPVVICTRPYWVYKNRSIVYFQDKKICRYSVSRSTCSWVRVLADCGHLAPGTWPPHLVLLQWPSGGATTSCHVQHNTSPTINPGIPSHRHQAAAFCTPVRGQNILQDIVFLSISDNHKKYFIFIIYICLMKLYGPSRLRS